MEGYEGREYEEQEEAQPAAGDTHVMVEIAGLSVYTHHGVTRAERETGQRLVFNVSLDLDDCDATVTDRVEDTIDYGAVCDAVMFVATERSYKTLERLCSAVADALVERFGANGVVVRATKLEPPLPVAVEEVSAEVTR